MGLNRIVDPGRPAPDNPSVGSATGRVHATCQALEAWSRQTDRVFDDFLEGMVEADGLQLFVRHAGTGPPVLLQA